MDGILYIPYVNTFTDDSLFDYNGPDFNYVNNLIEVELNIIGADNFQKNINNHSIGFYSNNKNIPSESDLISFYELKCKFFNVNGGDITIDQLLNEYIFFISFSFNEDEVDEDCIIELKSWITESKKIIDLPDENYTNEVKIELLPKRTFKLKVRDKKAELINCSFIDIDNGKIIIYVEKKIF